MGHPRIVAPARARKVARLCQRGASIDEASPGNEPSVSSEQPGTLREMEEPRSAVPDVLAADLRLLLVGINPGRASAAAGAHFANPRNDFWRLLHASGLTPRELTPGEQPELLAVGIGITNAALRTTPGSGDLRAADFIDTAARLERIALELRPAVIAFVGKEAYRGAFGERPALGAQARTLGDARMFVLPSTSPANAAVPWTERLHWFRELTAFVEEVANRRATRRS
jgi:double-stranded uracil-DNA glycosylase